MDPVAPRSGESRLLDTLRDDPLDVVVYTLGWESDRAIEPGEEPSSQIYARVFVNGREIPRASRVTVRAEADFLMADITVYPSKIDFVPLDNEAWAKLGKENVDERL